MVSARSSSATCPPAGTPRPYPQRVWIKSGQRRKLSSPDKGVMWRSTALGDPQGPVYTSFCVTNGTERNCHCTEFPTCRWTENSTFANKLTCIGGVGDPLCRATCSGAVDQGATMLDTCSGLEWEKKDTPVGSGVDAANLHDVDNRYAWVGSCSLDAQVLCQPTSAAAARCAETGGAGGCDECGPGQGTCNAALYGAISTVWDWLDGINASGFAGHADWRLPIGGFGGFLSEPEPGPAELRSLADHVCPSSEQKWCAADALGQSDGTYWTSTTPTDEEERAAVNGDSSWASWGVSGVDTWFPQRAGKIYGLSVRAVRSAP